MTLLPAAEYRVRGVLEEFRQEVWLEESVTGNRIGEKIVNKSGRGGPHPSNGWSVLCVLQPALQRRMD